VTGTKTARIAASLEDRAVCSSITASSTKLCTAFGGNLTTWVYDYKIGITFHKPMKYKEKKLNPKGLINGYVGDKRVFSVSYEQLYSHHVIH